MTFRKMLLLATVALAGVAFAAPAAAQAQLQWAQGGTPLGGEEEAVGLETEASITWTLLWNNTIPVRLNPIVWNETNGAGVVAEAEATGPGSVLGAPGCQNTVTFNSGWGVSLTSPNKIEMTGVEINNSYNAECQKYGFGGGYKLLGTLRGTIENTAEGSQIVLGGSSMRINGNGAYADIQGLFPLAEIEVQ